MLQRLSALLLVGLVALVAVPLPVDAAVRSTPPAAQETANDLNRPPAPMGGYRPRFVHQSQNNCAFASAAMLIDKWTGGRRRPDQARMRAASRVPASEGVGIGELARAVQAVTRMRVLWSPGGGDPLTWDGLMSRLAKGGAAVVAGSYSRLPHYYQRWNREYASLGPSRSGHAVYVERYEPGRRGGRVWMMDPLASGARYDGEWIAANDLKAFAWRSARGLVHAAATPEPPPLAGFEFGTPEVAGDGVALAGEELSISLPLRVRAGWSRPDNLALSVVWHAESLAPTAEEVTAAYQADVAAARVELAAGAGPPAAPDPRASEAADGRGAAPPDPADDVSAEALAAWRAARAAGESSPPATTAAGEADESAGEDDADESDGPAAGRLPRPTKPVVAALQPRGDALVARVTAPAAAGTYRVTVELVRRDGGDLPGQQAPRLADVGVTLGGSHAADYGRSTIPDEIAQGGLATIGLSVTNLGSADWRHGSEMRLVATWTTAAGSWRAASTPVTLRSLQSEMVELEVIAPTDVADGSLTLGLVTAEGVPMSEFGAQPVVLELTFRPPANGAVTADPESLQE